MIKANELLTQFNISKNDKVIVSVSGGVDSMVLLHFLLSNGIIPVVVHFNHHTRNTNERDQDLVTNFALNNNLKCYVIDVKVSSGNFQSNARSFRYKQLERIAKRHEAKYIATAHHLDDMIETVLIKLTRGSNLYGYSGIHPSYSKNNLTYIKPFVFSSKSEIVSYATNNGIPFFEDETNYTDTYLRNRYRHTIVPIMKQENPQLLERILSYHTQLSEAASYIKKTALEYIVNDTIDIPKFKTLDSVIQKEMISVLLNTNGIIANHETLNKIRDMLLSKEANSSYSLENNYQFIKTYEKGVIQSNSKIVSFDVILDNKETILPNMKKITFLNNECLNDKECVNICYNKISLPLHARTRKNGDKLAFVYGHKKLKDYFIDKKIPKHLRDEILLITDNDNTILWVQDLYINKTLGTKEKLIFKIGDKENA
ncbi:MAG: tRNA lysidine(34) synthetase TilS [Acholeplasma sp.]|nr:tRNA lysidine(34) synthetase TilS [Acholeplasma sp.]